MIKQALCINRDTGKITAAIGTDALPGLIAILGTDLNLEACFHDGSTAAALTHVDGSLNVSAQAVQDLDQDLPALLSSTVNVTGSGAATRYTLTVPCDAAALRAALGTAPYLDILFQFEWQVSGEASPRKSYLFTVRLCNSILRPGVETLPDIGTTAAYLWLVDSLEAGANITLGYNATTRKITIAATPPETGYRITGVNETDNGFVDVALDGVPAFCVQKFDLITP